MSSLHLTSRVQLFLKVGEGLLIIYLFRVDELSEMKITYAQ